MRDAGRRDGEQKNSVIEMMNVRPAGVEKEVRHPARHDKDHADARDHKGKEERDEREPRQMPDGPRRRVFRVSFFSVRSSSLLDLQQRAAESQTTVTAGKRENPS